MESYNGDVPLILAEDSKKALLGNTSNDKSHLDNIKTYRDWDTPGAELGLRQKIEVKLRNVKTSLSRSIAAEFRSSPLVFAMANYMLESSASFVDALGQYMSDTFITFRSNSVGSDKEIWSLVTFVARQLFENNFAKARQEAIGTLGVGSRDSGYKAIWCAMKSVNLGNQLVADGIKDTPAVSASYVRFVLN